MAGESFKIEHEVAKLLEGIRDEIAEFRAEMLEGLSAIKEALQVLGDHRAHKYVDVEYAAKHSPGMKLAHPGAILADVLVTLGLSVDEAADRSGISRQDMHCIVGESIAVSREAAERLGKLCNNSANFWIRLQANYDLWQARSKGD